MNNTHMSWRPLAATTLALLTQGCSQMGALLHESSATGEGSEQFMAVDKHSPYPAIRRADFEQVNLVELVDPEGRSGASRAPGPGQEPLPWGRRYDMALASFRTRTDLGDEAKRLQRDAVQDRLLAVSTSRCNVFKTYLRRQQSDTNFALGAATTVAGVLGSIATGIDTARYLAGTAGIFSGVQAEFNSSYYSNLAAHVIVQGIETHQTRLLAKLVSERQGRSISEYSMEAALRDAIHYDGTCSTVVGLLEASDAIKESVNPGMHRAAEVVAAVHALQALQALKPGDVVAKGQQGELDLLVKRTEMRSSPLVVSSAATGAASGSEARLVRVSLVESDYLHSVATELAQLKSRHAEVTARLSPADQARAGDIEGVTTRMQTDLATVPRQLNWEACRRAAQDKAGLAAATRLSALAQAPGSPARIDATQKEAVAQSELQAALARAELTQATLRDTLQAMVRPVRQRLDATPPQLEGMAAPALPALTPICPAS